MELTTKINIEPSPAKITYNDPAVFIGSCFSHTIGKKFMDGHLPVMINPSGTVFNPVSVLNTLESILSKKALTKSDLYNFDGIWLSFDHYTDFSSEDPVAVLSKINSRTSEAGKFLEKSRFLFVTFGTAGVFRWNKSGRIVSNCHKIPASEFTRELLTTGEIVSRWDNFLSRLNALYPELKVVFTVSPVRHLKDGAHGNQISKSVLLLAIEELLDHASSPVYFPAYEILMDDLRDYRFYAEDMVHPSQAATEYIWEAFTGSFFDDDTRALWAEANKITNAMNHRFRSGSAVHKRKFAETILLRIEMLEKKIPSADFKAERNYFKSLI